MAACVVPRPTLCLLHREHLRRSGTARKNYRLEDNGGATCRAVLGTAARCPRWTSRVSATLHIGRSLGREVCYDPV
ncbi:hypothetical protein E2C01_052885 [Portunus trituberculatus]|uniref:Uncharacterized protein n=1 Tax=Portunus trituberculatus TaxID=210409 RepID=A0A5B7GN22_PORTR|nr:hypothetical protein [Portunus trituberculatus]